MQELYGCTVCQAQQWIDRSDPRRQPFAHTDTCLDSPLAVFLDETKPSDTIIES
jgi:hypothetical protein